MREKKIYVVLRSQQSNEDRDTLSQNRTTIEAALGLANQHPARITALGVFDSEEATGICQEALDLGCDAALSIRVPVAFDFFGEALLLKAGIACNDASVVLCPDFHKGYHGSRVGSALAFMLGMPAITGVSDCRFKGEELALSRCAAEGVDQFTCAMPLVLALAAKPTIANAQRAQNLGPRKVESVTARELLNDLAVLYSRSSLAAHAAPRPRTEATELFSDPRTLLAEIQSAKLWNAK